MNNGANDQELQQDKQKVPQRSHCDIVTLIVGPEGQRLTIAQDVLCDNVPFFSNAFEGNYIEAKTKTFTFPDDELENFQMLLDWLKTCHITKVNSTPTWLWLAKSWIFGEKYHIDELQNEIVGVLHQKFATQRSGINISFDTLDYVVENTYPRSPLRRLFVDMLANGVSLQQLPSQVESIPPELLQDMVVALKEQVIINSPTATSLLTNPISTYFTSSAHCKATAMPARQSPSEQITPFYCDGDDCRAEQRPLTDVIWICTHHQCKFCESCARYERHHRLKLISLTTPAYEDSILGPNVKVIDGHINDSGFFCDGPSCDPNQDQSMHVQDMLVSGDRYHCLDCRNVDFCSLCVRGDLRCKELGHSMLRIRPTFAKRNALKEVSVPVRQQRARDGLCWRCGSGEHKLRECAEGVVAGVEEVDVEE